MLAGLFVSKALIFTQLLHDPLERSGPSCFLKNLAELCPTPNRCLHADVLVTSETADGTVTDSKEVDSVHRKAAGHCVCVTPDTLPKLGALCRVMSRITLVPKQDHISRNCCATFFRDPCLLAATYKQVNGFNTLVLHSLLALKIEGRPASLQVQVWEAVIFFFFCLFGFSSINTLNRNWCQNVMQGTSKGCKPG